MCIRDRAGHVPGQITGIDLFPGFIDIFNRNARQLGLQARVKGIVGSMDALPFGEEELDMIWCEGAIYLSLIHSCSGVYHPFGCIDKG